MTLQLRLNNTSHGYIAKIRLLVHLITLDRLTNAPLNVTLEKQLEGREMKV